MNMVSIMDKKLIFIDVDGTLYDNKNKKIHESTIKALHKLKQNGHKLVIATGRGKFMLYSIEEVLPLIDHYVLINGQQVIANHQIIFEDAIDAQVVTNLVETMDALGVIYGFESATKEAVNVINDHVIQSFELLNLKVPPKNPTFHLEQNVYQMWCFCDEEKMDILKQKHPEFQFLRWLTVGYDIIKQGQSKAKGVDRLIKHLGYNKKDTIAIGDGENDIDMLASVEMGIAMGNAASNVKEVSAIITDDIDNDGFYNAFKSLNLI